MNETTKGTLLVILIVLFCIVTFRIVRRCENKFLSSAIIGAENSFVWLVMFLYAGGWLKLVIAGLLLLGALRNLVRYRRYCKEQASDKDELSEGDVGNTVSDNTFDLNDDAKNNQ